MKQFDLIIHIDDKGALTMRMEPPQSIPLVALQQLLKTAMDVVGNTPISFTAPEEAKSDQGG
jgi:hypothetical protein